MPVIVKLLGSPVSLTTNMTNKGTYASGTTYSVGDVVSYNGSSYQCILTSTGNVPTNTTYWALLASKGDAGATGATGPQGPAGTSGNFQLVSSITANGSTTSVSFTSLSLDTDFHYRVEALIAPSGGSTGTLKWVANSDTTTTNYRYAEAQHTGGASLAATISSSNAVGTIANYASPTILELDIYKSAGLDAVGFARSIYDNAQGYFSIFGIGYIGSTSDITTLGFSSAINIPANSVFKLYKVT